MIPSDIPSLIPSLHPSNMGTMTPTPLKTPAKRCRQCRTYNDMFTINQAISLIEDQGAVCLCPDTWSGSKCPVEEDAPAIVIPAGTSVTLMCFTDGDLCIFECPQVLIHVESGARLFIEGQGSMTFTGGDVYSRVVVENGGYAHIEGVTFTE
jgi:hypothetical protein